MNCLGCLLPVSGAELLVCSLCKGTYHHNCVNMTSAYYKTNLSNLKREWQCPSCNNVTSRRRGADSTPVRSVNQKRPQDCKTQPAALDCNSFADSEHQTNMSCDESLLDLPNDSLALGNRSGTSQRDVEQSQISYNDFAALLDLKLTELKAELNKHFYKQIDSLRAEFNNSVSSLQSEINGLKHNVNYVTQKVSVLEEENKSLKQSLADCKTDQDPTNTSQALHDTISRLENELNDREQAALLNDLEISGIPEFKEESLAAKVGVKLDERDIVSVDRVGPIRETAAEEADGEEAEGEEPRRRPRPRPLVVRLARRALRDALLKAARVRRGATTEGIGLPDHTPTKFHIHDRLTKKNRVLFGKAREKGRIHKWRFIWTKDGRIYARKSESSKVHRIRSDSDLDRIFLVLPSAQNV